MTERVTIKIPRQLYVRLKEIVAHSGFSSVTDLVVYVMRDVAAGRRLEEKDELTDEEVKLVKNRLRKLGYLE